MNRLLPAIVVTMIGFSAVVVQAERVHRIRRRIRFHRQQVSRVEEQIKQGQVRIRTMQHKERLILERLDRMELELQQLQDNLAKLGQERACLRRQIADKGRKLELLELKLEKVRSILARRLRALYKFGQQACMDLLASVQDMTEFQHHWVYLRAVAAADNRLIHYYQQQQAEEERLGRALAGRRRQLDKLLGRIEAERQKTDRLKRQQVLFLQNIHEQEETYRRYVEELQEVSRELRRKIENLERQAAKAGRAGLLGRGFARAKGTLPYPVQGRVVLAFGLRRHRKFGTVIRHNGIEIATEASAPVMAVYAGQVLYSGWVKGYGNVIIIDHGDKYYTLTAHLSQVRKGAGEPVEAGEIIGSAGYSALKAGEGRVYFEIRHRGKAVDPQAWLLPELAHGAEAARR